MSLNKYLQTVIVLLISVSVTTILRCGIEDEKDIKFYKIKSCRKLNSSIIARADIKSFSSCVEFATEKHGLGFNFSPYKMPKSDDFSSNCEVLGCPDMDNLTNLVNDSKYDYYTLYGNTEVIANASCIPSVGVFTVYLDKENYTIAENICREVSGFLGHILSDTRTDKLSELIKTKILSWSKVAYVGLNDIQQEGLFVTPFNEPIDCFKYRAWAPGHPRSKRKEEDCVILDSERMWRTINCARELPFICEILPKPPLYDQYLAFSNTTCSDIRNRTVRKTCKKVKLKYEKAINTAVKYEKRSRHKCENN